MEGMEKFESDLRELVNRHCIDAACETPDYLIAQMVTGFLRVFECVMRQRLAWGKVPRVDRAFAPKIVRDTGDISDSEV